MKYTYVIVGGFFLEEWVEFNENEIAHFADGRLVYIDSERKDLNELSFNAEQFVAMVRPSHLKRFIE